MVEDLIDPQMEINKRRSNMLHILTTMAHSGWMWEKGALDEEQVGRGLLERDLGEGDLSFGERDRKAQLAAVALAEGEEADHFLATTFELSMAAGEAAVGGPVTPVTAVMPTTSVPARCVCASR